MESLKNLLLKLKDKLEEEKELLLRLDNPDDLIKVIEEKKELLAKIAQFTEEDLKKHIDIVEEIDRLSKRNLSLALNNMNLIDEIFSTIFEDQQVKQYSPYGEETKPIQSGIINKKI